MDDVTDVVMGLGFPGLIVVAVLVVTWVVKATTALKMATDWLPVVAVALGAGLGGVLLPEVYAAKAVTVAVIQGGALGLVAAGGKDLLSGLVGLLKAAKGG